MTPTDEPAPGTRQQWDPKLSLSLQAPSPGEGCENLPGPPLLGGPLPADARRWAVFARPRAVQEPGVSAGCAFLCGNRVGLARGRPLRRWVKEVTAGSVVQPRPAVRTQKKAPWPPRQSPLLCPSDAFSGGAGLGLPRCLRSGACGWAAGGVSPALPLLSAERRAWLSSACGACVSPSSSPPPGEGVLAPQGRSLSPVNAGMFRKRDKASIRPTLLSAGRCAPLRGAVAGHRPGSDRAPSVARAPCESLSDASASLCRVRLVERGSPHSLPLMESGRVSIVKTRSSV